MPHGSPGSGRAEITREGLQRGGITKASATFHVEANPVRLPDPDGLERNRYSLARRGAAHVQLGQLRVIDRHRQPVAVFRELSLSVICSECRHGRPFGLVRPPARADAMRSQVRDRPLKFVCPGANACVRQTDECGRLDRAANGLRLPCRLPEGPPRPPRRRRFSLRTGREDADQLVGQRRTVKVSKGQCQVSERRVREPAPQPVQAVGRFKRGRAARTRARAGPPPESRDRCRSASQIRRSGNRRHGRAP